MHDWVLWLCTLRVRGRFFVKVEIGCDKEDTILLHGRRWIAVLAVKPNEASCFIIMDSAVGTSVPIATNILMMHRTSLYSNVRSGASDRSLW